MFEIDQALLDRLLAGESAAVDWKAVGDPEKVVATLAAFANDYEEVGEGYVVCGVEEADGQSVLRGLSPSELKRIRNMVLQRCRDNVRPSLQPEVATWRLPDTDRVLLVFRQHRTASVVTLHAGKGVLRHFVRINDRVQDASSSVLIEMLQARGQLPSFLERPCPTATLADLDLLAVRSTLQPLKLPRPPEDYLEPGVRFVQHAHPLVVETRDGPRPTYLALALFGRDPVQFVRGCHAVLSVYPGTERTATGMQRYDLVGTIPSLIRQLLDRLSAYNGMVVDKRRPLGEQNRPRYSLAALQEVVVNAFAHRDYGDANPVRVTVFSDRIEVRNPGGLVSDLDPEALKSGVPGPFWRNESLAAFLLVLALAQAEGQGVPTIRDTTQQLAGRPPEYTVTPGQVIVVIPAAAPQLTHADGNGEPQGSPGILIVGVDGSIRPAVEAARDGLGLTNAPVVGDWTLPSDEAEWSAAAQVLWRDVSALLDEPLGELHVFLSGPPALGVLVGALLAPHRRLHVYHAAGDGFVRAVTIGPRFLRTGR